MGSFAAAVRAQLGDTVVVFVERGDVVVRRVSEMACTQHCAPFFRPISSRTLVLAPEKRASFHRARILVESHEMIEASVPRVAGSGSIARHPRLAGQML
jgi:hypothetical protein